MPDTDPNLIVDITGTTAAIATDYVNSSHFQVNKIAWGDTAASNRVTTSNPLPVDIRLATATIGITGSVGGLGNFKIINGLSGSTAVPLVISGTTNSSYAQVQINGNVQGTTNGVLLGITGNVNIPNGITIYGGSTFSLINPIGITGGRRLAFATDSVSITGSTVSVSYLPPSNKNYDTIAIYNSAGGTYIPVMLRDGSGNSLGSSGGALNVNIIGAGITATISVSAVVGVSQSSPFYIAGATVGPEVRVVGTQGASKAIPVVIVTDAGALSNKVVVDGTVAVNLESVNTNILTVDSKLSSLITNTENISKSMNGGGLTGTVVQTQITSTTRPSTVYTGTRTLGLTLGNTVTLSSQTLKTGITVKNKSGIDINIQGNGTTNSTYALGSNEILFIETNNLNTVSFGVTAGSATFTYIAT